MRLFNHMAIVCLIILAIVLSVSYNNAFAETACISKGKRYVVSNIIDLGGEELRLPDKSTLVVKERGGFINGRVSGNKIKIVASDEVIFASTVETLFENTTLKSLWYEDLLSCIIGNNRCTIEIIEGEYNINNPKYVKITNSLKGKGNVIIKHSNSFSVEDNVTIEGISWDGQDKAEFWMYCQPNNLTIRNCRFENYYGKFSGIVYWSHGDKDTEGLLIENCIFGSLGAKENGIIGDSDGSSFAIYTYRCANVVIRNNRFEKQFGKEDSDAIKLEGARINVPEKYPLSTGELYKYADIHAIVEKNVFVDVPKSPVKIFASGVKVQNNRMYYQNDVKTAIVRMFFGENIIVENNVANCLGSALNAIEVLGCMNVVLKNNRVVSTSVAERAFGELLRIEKSADINVMRMRVSMATSSKSNVNQSLVRLSGKHITIKNSFFQAPYSYYGIYAPLGVDELLVENTTIKVEQGIQYAFLINNAVREPQSTCVFNKCKFKFSSKKIDDATSYGAVFARYILVNDCDFDYAKEITLNAEMVDVKQSKAKTFNVQERKKR